MTIGTGFEQLKSLGLLYGKARFFLNIIRLPVNLREESNASSDNSSRLFSKQLTEQVTK